VRTQPKQSREWVGIPPSITRRLAPWGCRDEIISWTMSVEGERHCGNSGWVLLVLGAFLVAVAGRLLRKGSRSDAEMVPSELPLPEMPVRDPPAQPPRQTRNWSRHGQTVWGLVSVALFVIGVGLWPGFTSPSRPKPDGGLLLFG
jgi:hypothetical protein